MKIARYNPTATGTQKYIWNTVGSLANALSSMVLLSIVSRANGNYDGGIFSLAFSTAQLLTSVGIFEVRAIQSTDVNRKYPFSSYLGLRIISCCVMVLCAVGYAAYSWDTPKKAAAIIILCLYKSLEAFADVFQGLFQLNERIDISGKEISVRVLLSTLSFFAVISITGNMIAACISMVIVSVLWVLYYDISIAPDFDRLSINFNFNTIFKIVVESFPLFIGSFMLNYIVNAPKYAIDRYLDEVHQNTFGFLIMPAFVINLFSMFFFRPLLTKMARKWADKDYKGFNLISIKCIAWIMFLTVGAALGAYLLGIPILNLFSGQNLSAYRIPLVIIMLGGGGSATVTLLYYTIACMRKQYTILIGYAIGFIASIVLSNLLVKSNGIFGGSLAYAASTLSVAVVLLIIYITVMLLAKRKAKA